MTGFFLTFEGGEGSGKSTQANRLANFLRQSGWSVTTTREPGGSPAAEAIRNVILGGSIRHLGNDMETVLFAAARADHVETLIAPALRDGQIVICDRFYDSTRVYQSISRQSAPSFFDRIEAATVQSAYPDLTILLDIPAEEGLRRAAARRGEGDPDRFEAESVELHEARRFAFLRIAREEPQRCRIVDAARSIDLVARDIRDIVGNFLAVRSVKAAREMTAASSA